MHPSAIGISGPPRPTHSQKGSERAVGLRAPSASRSPPEPPGLERAAGPRADRASSRQAGFQPGVRSPPGLAATATATPPGSIPPGVVLVGLEDETEGCLPPGSTVSRSAPSICEQRNRFQFPCDPPLTVPVLRSYLPNGPHQ